MRLENIDFRNRSPVMSPIGLVNMEYICTPHRREFIKF